MARAQHGAGVQLRGPLRRQPPGVPGSEGDAMTAIQAAIASVEDERALRPAGRRVATIGGGTGPFALLSRLKTYPCRPTAIVSMSDSGGSSRRLMDEFGQLPFGDLRQSL